MSGPKVVRIITRDEVIEICRGHIAQLEAALAECKRNAARNKVLCDADLARWQVGLAHVEQLLQRDKFAEVRKQAPLLIDSMRHELSHAIEALVSTEAAARRREASLKNSARQLQAQLRSARVELPHELQSQLQSAVTGHLPADQLEKVVATALRSLPLADEQELTAAQRETLQAISGNTPVRTFADWLAESQQEPLQVKQLDRCLGQLAACEASESFLELSRKVDAAYQQVDARRRKLLIDSLCLEAAALVRAEQRHAAIRRVAADEHAMIRSSGDGDVCREGLLRLDQLLAQGQYDSAEGEIQKLQQFRAETARKRAAQAARLALLQGLQEMGYSVNEGMATIWSQQRSLVVRHPQQRGIAVELGTVGEKNQFQARVVAVQDERRDSKSDLQTETEWCDSLLKIQHKIVQCGGELKIERETPPGRLPLKVVRLDSDYPNDAIENTELRTIKSQHRNSR